MDYAYILASLPMLRFGEKPLVSMEEFRGSCALLSEKDAMELDLLMEGRLAECSSNFCKAWSNADTQLRSAVGRVRAERAGVELAKATREFTGYDMMTQKAAEDAMAAKDPMVAERFLDKRRWALLDDIAFEKPFEIEGVLAYAAKLTIAWRWAALDQEQADETIEDLVVSNLKDEGSMARFLDDEDNAAEE